MRSPISILFAAAIVASGARAADLQVADGVVVKFGPNAALVVRDNLSVGKAVTLTSQAEGQAGATPAAGDWSGVRLEKSATVLGLLDHLAIRYTGGTDKAALTLRGQSPGIVAADFSDNLVGLRVQEGAHPAISNSRLVNNQTAISADAAASTAISNSDLGNNAQFGVANATPGAGIVARGNWWGDASGPRHPAANPQGLGSAVTDGVDFGSFLATAPQPAPVLLRLSATGHLETHQVALTVACTGSVDYRLSESSDFTGVAFAPLDHGIASPVFILSAGDGVKPVKVQCRDSLGRIAAAELAGGVLVDTVGPTLAITLPAASGQVAAPITLEATASDPAGVERVEFYVQGNLLGSDAAAPFQQPWDNAALPDGSYDLRVVAIDKVGHTSEATRAISLVRIVVPPDTAGPSVSNLAFAGVLLSSSNVVRADGSLSAVAQDPAGVSRVEFWIDGAKVASDSTPDAASAYQGALSIAGLANGDHVLVVKAFDTLNNVSETTQSLVVLHDPPAAPRVTSPANGATVNNATLLVKGSAAAGTQVHLVLDGVDQAASVTTDAQGVFQMTVMLQPGANTIAAVAADAYGSSSPSPAITVTLDSSVPAMPAGLSAQIVNGTRIRLTWTLSGSPTVANYELYRSTTAFSTTSEAQRVARLSASSSTYDDQPATDGRYYYRLLAVNTAGTQGPLSAQVDASLDATAPYVVAIEYSTAGAFDAGSQTYGQGRVTAKLTVNEPLSAIPYLSVNPAGSTPIPVDLVKRDETHFEGSFVLAVGQGSGTATVLFSGRDLGGIRGTEIRQGGSLKIDTVGPSLVSIAIEPTSPIKVDASRQVVVDFGFDEAIPASTPPSLAYLLSGVGRTPITVTGLQATAADHWRASFDLPVDAGAAGVETMQFQAIVRDALGNVSTRISAENQFQLYQNDLPALVAPLGVKATAQPAGAVALEWQAVIGASTYQILRQAPGETVLSPLARTTTLTWSDATPVDGIYRYALSAVRSANGQESLSPQSLVVEARSSRTAPGAPQNLVLTLASQGVVASWQPPLGSAPASYRLYRSSQPAITSVAGLQPIKSGIKVAQAVDAVPSESEHTYAVTSVDAAGNESAPSGSVYLNFSLLPVRSLAVSQSGTELPLLEWAPNGSGTVAYDVFTGPDTARIKLTPTPTTATRLTDTGYTGGERRYTVESIDANNVRMARSIVLPNAGLQLVSGLPLKRGVMNRLGVQVSNLSATPMSGATLTVSAGAHTLTSTPFTVGANGTALVPVVIGGYADLPASTTLSIDLKSVPNEGESARIARTFTASVVDSALAFGLETENFISGATGSARITLENTSDVEVEIVTARNFGSSASNEMRFKLLDPDGNLMGTTAYRQATGAGVVTLANGVTVARIAPHQSYVSEPFQIVVPASSLDTARLRLEVDALHFHTGEADEVSIPATGTERSVSLARTPYFGEVGSVDPVQSGGGRDIAIQGRAVDRESNQAVPNTPLKLVINQEGFERIVAVTTGVDGSFRYDFKPSLTDSGLYKLSAIHPDMTDRPIQAQFSINRVTVSPTTFNLSVPRNYTYRIDFRAQTGAGAQAANVRLAYLASDQPSGALVSGLQVNLPAALDIAPKQNLSMPVTFTGDNSAPATGQVVLRVVRDDTPGELPAKLTINYTLTDAKPVLNFAPAFVEAGLAQGQSTIESLVLDNKGYAAMADVQAVLLDKQGAPAPAWISFASNPAIGAIAIGERRNIDLNIAPPAQLSEGIYEFVVRVSGSNLPAQDINVFVSVTQSGEGGVTFRASDIYTGTRDQTGAIIPGLAGARVFVQNQAVISQTYEGVTDALGEATFAHLPAGTYRYKLSAATHQEASGQFVVKPGLTISQPVFLEYTLISVEWSVREVTINDSYEITLNATYETDVPAPVVVIQPTSINLPKLARGEVYQGELVMTNYGLIRADNLHMTLPVEDTYFKFEFLALPPTSLEAKQRVRLPYRVIALRDYAGTGATGDSVVGTSGLVTTSSAGTNDLIKRIESGESNASSDAGCYTYTNQVAASCEYTCANGVESTNCGSGAKWFFVESRACPTGSSPIGSTTGGGSTGSGGVGGSGNGGSSTSDPGYTEMPGLPVCAKGTADCYEPQSKQSGTGKEGGE